jgi:hypothetical protein
VRTKLFHDLTDNLNIVGKYDPGKAIRHRLKVLRVIETDAAAATHGAYEHHLDVGCTHSLD